MFVEYKISAAANKKAQETCINTLVNNSIRWADGNVVGRLGELIAQKHFGGVLECNYEYDLLTSKGVKLDVKTKERTVPPKPHYEVSVADFNTKQKCDAYLFVSVMKRGGVYTRGWILGWMPHDEYFKKAKFHCKGEPDPSNGFVFQCDTHNMCNKDLNHDFSNL